MKKSFSLFLQIIIVFIGIAILTLMLWEPHLEGRNIGATPYQIYFEDPFLAYAYIASISFFIVLYQAFKLVGYAGQNKMISLEGLKALRIIKYCALALIGFVALGVVFILFSDSDDHAGGVAIGVFIALVSSMILVTAALLGQKIQRKFRFLPPA